MKNNKTFRIVLLVFALLLGIIFGGYLGYILGRTFLGNFNVYEIESYKLTLYAGSFVGAGIAVYLVNNYIKKQK